MKVIGTNGVGSATGPRPARPGQGEGFRLPSLAAPAGVASANSVAGTMGVMGMDALLALQDVGNPLERKRRAVGRAGRILDVLDDLKVALLDGSVSGNDLERLTRAVRDARDATEDPKLEAVLDEIELRSAVEMAKLEIATRAA
jgi:hypothetical protein